MTTRPLFDTRMMTELRDFYPSLVTLQEPVETQDANSGEVSVSWQNKAGYAGLACALAPNGGVEVKQSDQTYVVSNYTLALPTYHPEISEKWRAVVDAVPYEILLVQGASMGGLTRLLLRTVT